MKLFEWRHVDGTPAWIGIGEPQACWGRRHDFDVTERLNQASDERLKTCHF